MNNITIVRLTKHWNLEETRLENCCVINFMRAFPERGAQACFCREGCWEEKCFDGRAQEIVIVPEIPHIRVLILIWCFLVRLEIESGVLLQWRKKNQCYRA